MMGMTNILDRYKGFLFRIGSYKVDSRQPIGVVVVGAGMIAHRHLTVLKSLKGSVEIKSVCAGSLVSARRLAEKFGVRAFYSGYQQAFAAPFAGDELVLIAAPPHTHYDIAMAAISSGRHVLIEKPAALNSEQVARIASAAAENKKLAASFSARFALSELAGRLKEIISSGQLGRIYRIEIVSRTRRQRYGIEFNERARWALSKELAGGGALLDWGIYALALLDTTITLPPMSCVAGQMQYRLFPTDLPKDIVYDVEEAAYGLWRSQDGLLLTMDVAWAEHGPFQRHALILGTKGGVEARWVAPFSLNLFGTDKAGRVKDELIKLPPKAYDAELCVIENFLSAIKGACRLVLPLSREAALMDILTGCYQAAVRN